jgi:hypothetical protein
MPVPHDLPTSANTNAIGTASTTVEDVAIRPDNVSIATSDADIFHVDLTPHTNYGININFLFGLNSDMQL